MNGNTSVAPSRGCTPECSPHVDQFRSEADGANSSFDNPLRRGHKSDDRAVMIGIDVCVEHAGRLARRDRGGQPLDSFNLAAFTEVWYTLDQMHCRLSIADCRLSFVLRTLNFVLYADVGDRDREIAKHNSTKLTIRSNVNLYRNDTIVSSKHIRPPGSVWKIC